MKRLALAVLVFLSNALAQDVPARVPGSVMAGQLVSASPPVYPPAAKAAHVEGAVVLKAIIGRDGHIENLVAISGPMDLRAACMDAVRLWIYRPFLLNGNPTEVDTTITVNFSMANISAKPITAREPEPDFASTGHLRIPAGVLASLVISHPYPLYRREERIPGPTVLRVVIGKDGHVMDAEVLQGPPGRTAADLNAVKTWTFRPYLLNGEPTEVESTVTFKAGFGGS